MSDRNAPVYAFRKRASLIDYPGHMAAVFFVSGCNFKCGYCHNRPLMGEKRTGLSWDKLENLCEEFKRQWVDGVVVSGGEPTLYSDLPALLDFFRQKGFRVKLDTNGSNPEMLKKSLALTDYLAMDVKASLERYPELTGYTNTKRISESIGIIKELASDYEFRTTVIDGYHDDEEMERIGRLIKGSKRYVLQAFLPRENLPNPDLSDKKRTSSARLRELKGNLCDVADEVLVRGE